MWVVRAEIGRTLTGVSRLEKPGVTGGVKEVVGEVRKVGSKGGSNAVKGRLLIRENKRGVLGIAGGIGEVEAFVLKGIIWLIGLLLDVIIGDCVFKLLLGVLGLSLSL